jgi:hypothetical protein
MRSELRTKEIGVFAIRLGSEGAGQGGAPHGRPPAILMLSNCCGCVTSGPGSRLGGVTATF